MITINTVEDAKRQAKRIARATTVTHAQALDVLAVQHGFSHWSAFGADLAQRMPATPGIGRSLGERDALVGMNGIVGGSQSPTISIGGMLERVLGEAIPAIRDCRHVIVSGSANVGKTTALSRLLHEAARTEIVHSIEDSTELMLPNGAVRHLMPEDAERQDADVAAAEALRRGATIVAVGELSNRTIETATRGMHALVGPCFMTTVHAQRVADVDDVVRHRMESVGLRAEPLPAGVALIHIMRDHRGVRRITDIEMTKGV